VTELFKRSVAKTDFSELHKLIHGQVKTGKTTVAAQMKVGSKEPLFITTEDGHHALGVYAERVTSWLEFKNVVSKIVANSAAVKSQFSCVVLDLISDLDQWCEDYSCNELKVKNLGDLDWSKGWTFRKKEIQAVLSKLMSILPVTFICHSKEKEMEIDGQKVDIFSPNLSGAAYEYINGKVDMIGYITPDVKTKKTYITFRPTKLAIAGTRFTHMAKEFELNPADMSGSYKAINEAFINKQ
jgi:hypothetical protein